MTHAPIRQTLLPGSEEFTALLADIAAGSKDRDLNDENPFDQVAALKRAGFGTLRLPAEFGGPGYTVRQLFSTLIEVAQADPIVAHIFRTHFWFVEERLRALRADPGDEVSQRWLQQVAAGKLFANAFSEKGSLAVGSLVFNTRLLPDGTGGFRLNGEKYYSTGTLFSDYLTVTTTTDHDSVASVIVPSDRTGVALIDDWDGFGQRRTGTGTTVFDNVAVAAEEVLVDTPYDAEPEPTVQYAALQLYIHAVVAGVLAAVVDDGAALLRSRTRSFSHALTAAPVDDPLYQKLLGELASTAYIARAAVLDAADAIGAATDAEDERGVPDARLAAEAQLKVAKVKVHLDAIAPEAASRLLELGGASASSRQRNLDRHWRNIRTITLHNPVVYKARVIGENLLHGTPIPANAYF
ncbi:acyl-CoA dehydrogenase family protein [[Mycobacterium] burgundiense]|uniref:Dibenzothiophene monooxygenase n=1 Tax=[Mycobacterium] burgundiense TaxID=3064286 RepID=A0ABN9N3D9_9MYCO|nr:acyl-CoA dehydrogenase family protein [Mycolicibacterium sp. MU0053]CAJ1498652.1 acyl-CoA dehydrogenase family protein [Mycolicibacterium sp. MU0053]